MKEQKRYTIGIDIGGSHISSAAIDVATFKILPGSSYSAAIDNRLGKEEILSQWARVISNTLSHLINKTCLGIAFAMPGPFDYPNGIAKFEGNDKYENLYNVPVGAELQKLLNRPELILHFFNDASCFGVGAEKRINSTKKRTVGLTLGTGLGSVFLNQGVPLLKGATIPENGSLWSLPFKNSIADDYFGTRWFLKAFKHHTALELLGVKEIIDTEHPGVQEIFNEYAQNLGGFILPHLLCFEAQELMLGGNIAKSHPYFLPKLKKLLASRGFDLTVHIITQTEKCNILGACQLMLMDYWKNREKSNSPF